MFELVLDAFVETPNKLRYRTFVEEVDFSLYIPKSRVPDRWPGRAIASLMTIKEGKPHFEQIRGEFRGVPRRDWPVLTYVRAVEKHANSIRFRPEVNKHISDLYVPYAIVPETPEFIIRVDWDTTSFWVR